MADPTVPQTTLMLNHPFTRWRDEAGEWARALRSAQLLGNVVLAPMVAERIAAMLLEAEPPGTGAQQIKAGYEAGGEDGKRS